MGYVGIFFTEPLEIVWAYSLERASTGSIGTFPKKGFAGAMQAFGLP